ncbi:MAG: DUF3050 domain-containing protein [Deltaproteobacteria bacterium]|jgi:hypothetical protein
MLTNARLRQIEKRCEPIRRLLLGHPMYERMDSMEAMHLFMAHHVFAVWDFMTLLKVLQQHVTCTEVPWRPSVSRKACRFINEIVLGEESDADGDGGYASHFELYKSAMVQAGASTETVDDFLGHLEGRDTLRSALDAARAPLPVRHFVCETFALADRPHEAAAAFTFGREDLLPDVFQKIVDRLDDAAPGHLGGLRYYLERHIELDGDHHGPMALSLVEELCGDDDDRWNAASDAAVRALEARLVLWDGVAGAIERSLVTAI